MGCQQWLAGAGCRNIIPVSQGGEHLCGNTNPNAVAGHRARVRNAHTSADPPGINGITDHAAWQLHPLQHTSPSSWDSRT